MTIRRLFGLALGLILALLGLGAPAGAGTAAGPEATGAHALPAGRFHTAGTRIIDAAGRPFVPVGANVGTISAFDWRGNAIGHAADARAWGWSAIRLNLLASGVIDWSYVAANGYPALLRQIDGIVAEYTRAGIVVMLDAHDDPSYDDSRHYTRITADMDRFWHDAAVRYAGNSRVWFNLINEPAYTNAAWYRLQARFAATIRATGAKNIIVVDAPDWGQDLGPQEFFPGSKYAYDPSMAPALAKRFGNLVLSQHNYGAYYKYTSAASLAACIRKVRASGIPLLFGEYGYTIDGSSTAGGWDPNHKGALAVWAAAPAMGVGYFWWHATHGDNYSLKADGNAFFADGGPSANLSDAGRRLWALRH